MGASFYLIVRQVRLFVYLEPEQVRELSVASVAAVDELLIGRVHRGHVPPVRGRVKLDVADLRDIICSFCFCFIRSCKMTYCAFSVLLPLVPGDMLLHRGLSRETL